MRSHGVRSCPGDSACEVDRSYRLRAFTMCIFLAQYYCVLQHLEAGGGKHILAARHNDIDSERSIAAHYTNPRWRVRAMPQGIRGIWCILIDSVPSFNYSYYDEFYTIIETYFIQFARKSRWRCWHLPNAQWHASTTGHTIRWLDRKGLIIKYCQSELSIYIYKDIISQLLS